MDILRSDWPGALSQLHHNEIKEAADALTDGIEVIDVVLPQAGLGLLALREGAFQESFFLGEIPVARADVILRMVDGCEIRGGTVLVDDRVRLARAIAILDAVLSGRLPGYERAENLVERGNRIRMDKMNERKQMLAATRVDFSLLGQEADEDVE